jgi:lipid-A-disaccharide synthase
MQNKKLKVFIIAGEVSGDVLGGKIMHEMPNTEFVGIGGEHMRAAGLKPIFPMRDLAVMGAIEVLAHARTLTKRINQTVNAIINERPDVVLTIDSPGFAQNVISKIRRSVGGRNLIANGMRFHHVVAPQVWAWRPGRAKKYAKLFDKLYAFFDFELPYFTKYGLDTIAVGHPISDGLIGQQPNKTKEKIITLVPGSRMSEVKRLMPLYREFVETLNRLGYHDYQYVIPTVETTDKYVRGELCKWPVTVDVVNANNRYNLYAKTYIAIVASGTVSAELAMMHIPAIVVYRMNPITVWLVRQFIRVRWVSLVNILLNRGVYPELLGPDANYEKLVNEFTKLTVPANRKKMVAELASADNMWQRSNKSPARIIANDLQKIKKQGK